MQRNNILYILLFFLFTSCRKDMQEQPKLKPLSESVFFSDSTGSRQIVEGTVSETDAINDTSVTALKPELTKELLNRGQSRFTIYCSPCHGRAGYGDGMIVRRGFSKPPNFHTDSLRSKSDKDFLNAMAIGYGSMPDYAAELSQEDRWAVLGYIRALQISQHVQK